MTRFRIVVASVVLLFVLNIRALGVMLDGYVVPSNANLPTLRPGDRVAMLDTDDIGRGDIVIFAGGDSERVSRVVAVADDRVAGRDGRLVLDGALAREPYLARGTVTSGITPVTVPPGYVYVLGDNRSNSADSRVFGPVRLSDVLGRVEFRYWPPGRLARL